MSEATLTNLLEYLYDTLTPSNMLWVAEHLTEHAKKQKPYTVEELLERAEEGRRQIAMGHYTDIDDMIRELDQDFEEDNPVVSEEELQLEAV